MFFRLNFVALCVCLASQGFGVRTKLWEPEDLDPGIVRKYRLRGMVVHSGQASGGHYYSYIKVGTWL